MRPARTVRQARDSFSPVPADPLVAGGGRTALRLGGHRNGPAELEDPFHQELAAMHGELRPRMSHESLLADGLIPVEQGGSHFLNNVLGNYT